MRWETTKVKNAVIACKTSPASTIQTGAHAHTKKWRKINNILHIISFYSYITLFTQVIPFTFAHIMGKMFDLLFVFIQNIGYNDDENLKNLVFHVRKIVSISPRKKIFEDIDSFG